MHVVIMGCGRVGVALTSFLQGQGHSVAIIDRDPNAFRRLDHDFSGFTVTGVGHDKATLLTAGIDHAEAFAAVSSGDNSNIIAARVARETFLVPSVVTRIYDPRRATVFERFGIPTVASVAWTADQILQILLPENHYQLWSDPSGTVGLMELELHPGWVGQPVHQLESATGVRVGCLMRFGSAIVVQSDMIIQANDRLYGCVSISTTAQVNKITRSAPERFPG